MLFLPSFRLHRRQPFQDAAGVHLLLVLAALTQIAEQLNLSVKTVSVYRARLLEKMKLKNNAELTHYALKHGLVE